MNIAAELADLRERVERLESAERRTTRGHCSQRRAGEYIGRSREWLRLAHRRGRGPKRNPDGTYSYDDLDLYKQSAASE